ncbi:MAG: hypothetical protein V1872_10795 [bacterium]
MNIDMYTIKQLFEDIHNNKPYKICLGNFLDDYYYSESEIKKRMIQEEPNRHPEIERFIYAYVAASVHKLANDYNLDVPAWVFDEFYFLKEPHFAMNARGKLRLILMYESPAEFKFRNLFEVANTLSRV